MLWWTIRLDLTWLCAHVMKVPSRTGIEKSSIIHIFGKKAAASARGKSGFESIKNHVHSAIISRNDWVELRLT